MIASPSLAWSQQSSPSQHASPFGPVVSFSFDDWDQQFQFFGVTGTRDHKRLQNISLLGHDPKSYLQFLAESLRSRQVASLLKTRGLLNCEQGEGQERSCPPEKASLLKRLVAAIPDYKIQVVMLYGLLPTTLIDQWPFLSRETVLPAKVSISKFLTPLTSMGKVHLSQEDQTKVFKNLTEFLTTYYWKHFGRALKLSSVFDLKAFLKRERQLGKTYTIFFKAMDAFRDKTKMNLDQQVRSVEPLLALYTQSSGTMEGVDLALREREFILTKLIHKPMDLTVIQSLSPSFVRSLGELSPMFPGFVRDLQTEIQQRSRRSQKRKMVFMGAGCVVALVFEAWPICAVIGGWQWGGEVKGHYETYKEHHQVFLSQTGEDSPRALVDVDDLDASQKKLIQTSGAGILIPFGAIKVLPPAAKVASSTRVLPKVAGWLRWPFIKKGPPVEREASLFSPLKCLYGSCRTVDKALKLLFLPKQGTAVRSWFRPFTVPVVYYSALEETLFDFANSRWVNQILRDPRNRYHESLAGYQQLLADDPGPAHRILSVLYRLKESARYQHVLDFSKDSPLSLSEMEELMEQTDDQLAELAKSPHLRKSIGKFLNGELSWSQLKAQSQQASNHVGHIEEFLETQLKSPEAFGLGIRILDKQSQAPSFEIQMKATGALETLSHQSLQFLRQNLASVTLPLSHQVFGDASGGSQRTLARYYALNSLAQILFLNLVPVQVVRDLKVDSQQRRGLFKSALEALISVIEQCKSDWEARSLYLEALGRVKTAFEFSKVQPVTFFEVEGRNRLEMNSEVSIADGFRLVQEILFYGALMELNQDPGGDHMQAITTEGDTMGPDVEQLLAMAARAAGHDSFQSGLIGMLQFSGEFESDAFATEFIKNRLSSPVLNDMFEDILEFF